MTDDEHELRVLLGALDNAPLQTPSYADDLWTDLDSAFDHATAMPRSDLVSDDDDGITLVPLDAPHDRNGSSRSRRVGVAAFAIASLVAIVVGLATLRDPASDDVVSVDDTVTVPVLVDSTAACARYHNTDPTLPDLAERLVNGQPVSVADVEAASTAVDVLATDLRAAGIGASGANSLDTVLAQLGQAEIEVDRGLLDQATRTLALARATLTDALDGSGTSLPASCAMPNP